ncbi:snRNA-activating protein complex subunit 1 [Periplaneta americana]|uniref:snRNA-activating protein complex subunit 1 n=1 Tax=Periplaneta americana TaxID=6978 RepID=UPI0037E81787
MSQHYIAVGVKTDCVNLLEKFTATKSVRFQEFLKIWKEMKFPCIYCGRESFAELYEFTEEVLKIAKEFFLPPNPLQTRLCGLYLLYGLYNKQPTIEEGKFLVKIRFNLKEWQDSCSLVKVIREEQHYDALFIFNKLLSENAFYFCAMPREYGLEKSIRKYLERGEKTAEDPLPKSELLTLENNGLLQSLDELSKKYYEFKCALNKDSKKTTPHRLLDYASASVVDDIRKLMAPLVNSSDVEELENDNDDIGNHRKRLKNLAYFGAGPSNNS